MVKAEANTTDGEENQCFLSLLEEIHEERKWCNWAEKCNVKKWVRNFSCSVSLLYPQIGSHVNHVLSGLSENTRILHRLEDMPFKGDIFCSTSTSQVSKYCVWS